MPTNQNNVPTYHSAFLKVWFYFFFYSHYKIQIKHFDFAFRGFKFLETEGSNFCGEGSFTPLLPHNHKIMQKKIKSLRSHPMCRKPFISAVYPIFCSFPLYQLSEFYFVKTTSWKPLRENHFVVAWCISTSTYSHGLCSAVQSPRLNCNHYHSIITTVAKNLF